jgi:preprotein translocase subunit SecG
MFTFLLVLLVIDSFVLIAAILLQSGKGNGLAASFGGVSSSADSLLGTRQAGNLLTKASWWGGALLRGRERQHEREEQEDRAPKSALDDAFRQAPAPATAPAATPGANNTIPLTPATPTPAPAQTPAPSKTP